MDLLLSSFLSKTYALWSALSSKIYLLAISTILIVNTLSNNHQSVKLTVKKQGAGKSSLKC